MEAEEATNDTYQDEQQVTDLLLRAAAAMYMSEHKTDTGVKWLIEQVNLSAGRTSAGNPAMRSQILTFLNYPQSNPLTSTVEIGSASLVEMSFIGGSLPPPSASLPSFNLLKTLPALLHKKRVVEESNNSASVPSYSSYPSASALLTALQQQQENGTPIVDSGNNNQHQQRHRRRDESVVDSMVKFYILCRSLLEVEWGRKVSKSEIDSAEPSLLSTEALHHQQSQTHDEDVSSLLSQEYQDNFVFRGNNTKLHMTPSSSSAGPSSSNGAASAFRGINRGRASLAAPSSTILAEEDDDEESEHALLLGNTSSASSPSVATFHQKILAGVKKSLKVVNNRDVSLPVVFNHSLDWLVSISQYSDRMLSSMPTSSSSGSHKVTASPLSTSITHTRANSLKLKLHQLLTQWSLVVFDFYISLEDGEAFELAFYQFLAQRLLNQYRGSFLSVASLDQAAAYRAQAQELLFDYRIDSGSNDTAKNEAAPPSPQLNSTVTIDQLSATTPTKNSGSSAATSPSSSPLHRRDSTSDLVSRTIGILAEQNAVAVAAFSGSRSTNNGGGGGGRAQQQRESEDNDVPEEGEDGGAQLGLLPNNTLSAKNAQGLYGLANAPHEAVFIHLLRFFVGTTVTSKIDSMFGDCKISEDTNKEFKRRFGVVPPVAVRTCWMSESVLDASVLTAVRPLLSSSIINFNTTANTATVHLSHQQQQAAATITPHTLVPLNYDVASFTLGHAQSSDILNHEDVALNPYKKKEAATAGAAPVGGSKGASSSSSSTTPSLATPLLQQLASSPVLPHGLHVSVLTRGLWPAFPTSSDIALPVAAVRTFQVFKKYYLTKFPNRRLELCKRLGTFEISLCVPVSNPSGGVTAGNPHRIYNLLVPTQCAPVLLLFDEALSSTSGGVGSKATLPSTNVLTIKSITELTNQPEQDVIAAVMACVDGVRPIGSNKSATTTTAAGSTFSNKSILKINSRSSMENPRRCNNNNSSPQQQLTMESTVEFNNSFYHEYSNLGIGFVTAPLPTGASSNILAPSLSSTVQGRSSNNNNRTGISHNTTSSSGGLSAATGDLDGGEGSGGADGGGSANSRHQPRSILQDRTRRSQLSVTIVKLLKRNSPMTHTSLLEQTQFMLRDHFPLSVEDFKREVDVLMSKQFVARVDGAPSSYRYVP